jgi:hypothetical protein
VSSHAKDRSHNSNEYTGHVKFDPRDWEAQTAKSVGNYTMEKVDLVGAEVTVLTSYEYDTGMLRVFGSIDKKFKWADKVQRPIKKQAKKQVYISQADKCALEWEKDDICKCNGSVYFGTWSSIMLDAEQSMVEKSVDKEIKCDRKSFGDDPVPGARKECFCEKPQKQRVDIKQSDKCADEG